MYRSVLREGFRSSYFTFGPINVIEADSNAIHHSEAELNWALNPAGQAPQHKERIPLLSNPRPALSVDVKPCLVVLSLERRRAEWRRS